MNTSVAHNMHHRYFKGNYGLYFTIWDRLMGTLRNDYDENFDAVASRINPTRKIEAVQS
jgi:sterol desaturase/sphingolipid hydroxylase (fatty acid hydroxylase superfamily)